MKGLTIGLMIPTVIFATLFGIERMNHQATQAELASAEQKLTANSALQASLQEEQTNLEDQLNALRASHNSYVTDVRAQIEDLEATRDEALRAAKTAKTNSKTNGSVVADADLDGEDKPEAAFAKHLGRSLSKMLDAPAMKERMKERQLKRLDRTHAALFKKLGLSEDEIDTFKNLLADRKMSGMGSGLSFLKLAGNDPGGIETHIADTKTKAKEAEAELKNFLGDDGYDTYKQYEKTLPQRQTVDRVAKALADSDSPLTDGQSDRLIELMHETQTAAHEESMKDIIKKSDDGQGIAITLDSSDFQERSKAQNDLILKQAEEEGLLDDSQQAALEKQLNRQANNPFGAMMGGSSSRFSFGGDTNNGSVNIQMMTPEIEIHQN